MYKGASTLAASASLAGGMVGLGIPFPLTSVPIIRAHSHGPSIPPLPQTGEEHMVTHLQYVSWPDHGVPDDSSDFLKFVSYMRSLRVDNEPILVHCRY